MFLTHIIFVIFGQVTQQVFMAKEWYHDARKRADAETLSHADVEKLLRAIKQEQSELFEKLKMADQAHSSTKAGLKTKGRLRSNVKNCT